MTQQYPQQPYPPQQPGWTPPPPKKTNVGKIIGLGCAGVIGLFVVIGIIGAVASSSDDSKDTGASSVKPAATTSKSEEPAASTEPSKAAKSTPKAEAPKSEAPKKKVVTFKVWGTAPAGALGPLDITYGSDSDNRKGSFKNGKFEATLPLDEDAMYYTVMAQLQGSGDINCSITVDGHTEKGHASGGYNICNAQANAGLLGGWD
ncbi:hypothetical protein ACWD25_22080 [Streptomyces sp. NPDC002920]